MSNEQTVTEEGLRKLKEELDYLKVEKRKENVEAIRTALSFGDISENSEYDEAMSDQAKMEARIADIEYMLAHAKVLDESTLSTERVHTGLSVRVYDRTFEEECTYHIVGVPQANPAEDKISDESPIGKGLLGRKVGEVVTVEIPNGYDEMEILEIFKG